MAFTAQDVVVRYGRRVALDRASIAIEPGTFTVLVGPNGAGKSTLLKALSGDVEVTAGTVNLDGSDISRLHPRVLALRRAVLPQASSVSFPLTVHEVVRLGLSRSIRRDAIGETIADALGQVDLAGFGGRYYHQLSGGERQRVHLARVLCQVPIPEHGQPAPYLFLDEPTTGLDIKHQSMILEVARSFAVAGGGVLAVLHDLNLAATYADRVVVVRHGTIAAIGTAADVIHDAMILDTYDVAIEVSRPPPRGVPFVLPQSIRAPSANDQSAKVTRLAPRLTNRSARNPTRPTANKGS